MIAIGNLLWSREGRPLIYLFVLALVLRLGYLAAMLGQITPDEIMKFAPDTIRYVNIGRELLDLHIVDEGAVLIFGPGYGGGSLLFFSYLGSDHWRCCSFKSC